MITEEEKALVHWSKTVQKRSGLYIGDSVQVRGQAIYGVIVRVIDNQFLVYEPELYGKVVNPYRKYKPEQLKRIQAGSNI
jgi:hypothetical protein|tara:strand:- start:761 stop:1000 length:240 start_codon:yes stop_codon:yes gene_type:complete